MVSVSLFSYIYIYIYIHTHLSLSILLMFLSLLSLAVPLVLASLSFRLLFSRSPDLSSRSFSLFLYFSLPLPRYLALLRVGSWLGRLELGRLEIAWDGSICFEAL